MNNPSPRVSRFMGSNEHAQIAPDGTWIEPESITYPSGGFHRRAYVVLRENEHNPIELPYGEKRVVLCSIPDSYFTIPARLKNRGKTVKGYISQIDGVTTFTPNASDECRKCSDNEGCKR